MTTLSDGGDRLTTWNQRGGGGRVQAPRDPSLHKRFLLQRCPRKAKSTSTVPEAPMVSGRTRFVFSRANGQELRPLLTRQWGLRTSNVTFATPKTAFAIGFNCKVSMSY